MMNFAAIGCDLVKTERIGRLVERYGQRFLRKVTMQEDFIEEASMSNKERMFERVSGMWAVREATFKAWSQLDPKGARWSLVSVGHEGRMPQVQIPRKNIKVQSNGEYSSIQGFSLYALLFERNRETVGKIIFKLVLKLMQEKKISGGDNSLSNWWWQKKQVTLSERLLKRLQLGNIKSNSTTPTWFWQKKELSLSEQFFRTLQLEGKEEKHPLVWIGFTLAVTLVAFKLKSGLTRRFRTAMDIPPEYYKQQRILTGRVVAVNDSDNLRIRHLSSLETIFPFSLLPAFFGLFISGWRTKKGKDQPIKYETINVRLAGIDAPELGHFTSKPAQPLAEEALQWLKDRTLGRTVHFQLLRLDQYSRAVCLVYTTRTPHAFFWWWRTWINVEMVRTGLACIYRLGGKEYGALEEALEKAEKEAKRRRRGMWGLKNLVLPADYKKQ